MGVGPGLSELPRILLPRRWLNKPICENLGYIG
jgi:hypothetical protein